MAGGLADLNRVAVPSGNDGTPTMNCLVPASLFCDECFQPLDNRFST